MSAPFDVSVRENDADFAGALAGLAIRSAYLKGEWIKNEGRRELEGIFSEGKRLFKLMTESGLPLERRSDNPFVRGWSNLIHPGTNVWSAARHQVEEAFKGQPKGEIHLQRAKATLKQFQEVPYRAAGHHHHH